MKKLLCILTVVCMFAGAMPVLAANNTCGENVYWDYAAGYLYITGDGEMDRYLNPQGFGDTPWDEYQQEITTVVIGRDVKLVFLSHFERCRSLRDIYYQGLYGQWEEICGDYLIDDVNIHFLGTNNEWITIKNTDNLAGGTSLFNGQRWIFDKDTLTIQGYGHIKDGIRFEELPYNVIERVTTLVIEDGITHIDERAFKNLTNLRYVEIADSVKIVDDNAFSDCRNLSIVNLGNGVTNIGKYAFSGCSALEEIYIGDNLSKIGKYAFSGCGNIESIYVKNRAVWEKIRFDNEAANPARNGAAVRVKSEIPENYILNTQKPNEKGETAPGISDASYSLDTENMIPIVAVIASQAPEVYNGAQNAVDGSAYTRWAAYGSSDIVFDLGSVQYVEGANAYFWRYEVRSMPYKLYVSADGEKYEKVYDGTSPQGAIKNYASIKKNVRYIKMVIDDPGFNGWMSLNEFIVYSN